MTTPTQHITQEQAAKLMEAAEGAATKYLGDEGEFHQDHHEVEAMFLCNAAIQHYIDNTAPAQPVDVALQAARQHSTLLGTYQFGKAQTTEPPAPTGEGA
jgi:hypothetical protein